MNSRGVITRGMVLLASINTNYCSCNWYSNCDYGWKKYKVMINISHLKMSL